MTTQGGEVGPPLVRCAKCSREKCPWGRSAPLEMSTYLCDFDCDGYTEAPRPSSLWPGETREEFGYGG